MGKPVVELHRGDARVFLQQMQPNSVDALVTDPPAGIDFMGKHWDGDKGGRASWVMAFASIFKHCYRVMKPGAHGLVWGLPRTLHWTMCALEDAGFEVRDLLMHLFGSGFPKSLDISKAIDKAAGVERVILGKHPNPAGKMRGVYMADASGETTYGWQGEAVLTAPTTPEAQRWQGWGTALKPAWEGWVLVRKPLLNASGEDGTVVENVRTYGTGGINIDASRLHGPDTEARVRHGGGAPSENIQQLDPDKKNSLPAGRFPSNLVLSHTPNCKPVGTREVKSSTLLTTHDLAESENTAMAGKNYARHPRRDYAPDGVETVENWECVPDCPVRALDEQSGELKAGVAVQRNRDGEVHNKVYGAMRKPPNADVGYGDAGGASRFFYCAKPANAERDVGGVDNVHPTVKPKELMGYLIRLITPPRGVVLDPFMGSGSTGVAAREGAWSFIGIEREPNFYEIAEKRINAVCPKPDKVPGASYMPPLLREG